MNLKTIIDLTTRYCGVMMVDVYLSVKASHDLIPKRWAMYVRIESDVSA